MVDRSRWCAVDTVQLVALLLVVLLVVGGVQGKTDHNQPHPHRGILKAYEPGPFDIQLSRQEEQKLEAGQPIMKQTVDESGDDAAAGGAICVQDVAAPPSVVWDQILDFDSYKGKVPKVLVSKNYFHGKTQDGHQRIKTKMVLSVLPGYSYTSHYDHVVHKDKDSMTWKLDYEKTSDFDDVSGHWHVVKHPTKANFSRVFYACDVKMKGSVPGPILNQISKAALKQATGWVKKESEKVPIPAKEGSEADVTPAVEVPRKRKFAFFRQ